MKIDIHALHRAGSVKNYSEWALGGNFGIEMFE